MKKCIPILMLLLLPRISIAAAPIYFDLTGIVVSVIGYIVILVALLIRLAVTKSPHKLLLSAFTAIFAIAPFVWIFYGIHMQERRNLEILERQKKGAKESQEIFIRFCREKGEAIEACKKYRP